MSGVVVGNHSVASEGCGNARAKFDAGARHPVRNVQLVAVLLLSDSCKSYFVLFRVNREKVREEYDSLVQNIFTAATEIKKKYDELRYEKTRTISSRSC